MNPFSKTGTPNEWYDLQVVRWDCDTSPSLQEVPLKLSTGSYVKPRAVFILLIQAAGVILCRAHAKTSVPLIVTKQAQPPVCLTTSCVCWLKLLYFLCLCQIEMLTAMDSASKRHTTTCVVAIITVQAFIIIFSLQCNSLVLIASVHFLLTIRQHKPLFSSSNSGTSAC